MNSRELKAMRVRAGYKSNEFADMVGINKYTYSRKENGRLGFTDDEKARIMRVLEMTPEQYVQVFVP